MLGFTPHLFRIIGLCRAPCCDMTGFVQLVKAVSDFCSCCFPNTNLGDFNLSDLYSMNLCRRSAVFLDLFESRGFEQLAPSATRAGAMLDLVLCNKKSLVEEVWVGPPLGSSDHSTVMFLKSLDVNRPTLEWERDFSGVNYKGVREITSATLTG